MLYSPLDGVHDFFSTPHDRPPNRLLMLTAYLDESGHESNDIVVVAGFLGNEEQWAQCDKAWTEGLGNRKSLHMNKLRWSHDSVRRSLATLGPIPHSCGLTAIVAGIQVQDYYDLVKGTRAEKLTCGYQIGVMVLIHAILKNTPTDETVKLVFEAQSTYERLANLMFNANKNQLTPTGKPRLSSIEYVSKDSSVLTQPADYLAYAMLQEIRNPTSKKAKWCKPIRDITRNAFGRIPDPKDRDSWRGVIERTLRKFPYLAIPNSQ
jgi:hypothetical protein